MFFASLCVLCVYIFHVIPRALLGASGTRDFRRGRSPCPDALLRVGVIRGWMMGWWVYWWTELSDGLLLIFEGYFWSDWRCFNVLTDSITSYLWCSLLFICSVPTLPPLSPAPSFAEISPEVILRDGVRNGYICSIWNNCSIIKPYGWDFVATPTRSEV